MVIKLFSPIYIIMIVITIILIIGLSRLLKRRERVLQKSNYGDIIIFICDAFFEISISSL